MARTITIDIGGTKFSVGAFRNRELVHVETRQTNREGGADWMVSQIESICKGWQFKPDRCGIGFGGPVDFPTQRVIQSTHVSGWDEYPLVKRVEAAVGARAIMDNDANVGALGEYRFGAGHCCDPLFYMTLSTGIGGGIIINAQVHRGADSYAGELGHMMIAPDGPECLCGSNGCFERMCCGLWLERDYGRSAQELMQDPDFVQRYCVLLARGFKAVIMIMNPVRIVIGGGISKAGDRLFVPLRNELKRQITSWSHARQDVVPAELGDRSVLYGALALAEGYL